MCGFGEELISGLPSTGLEIGMRVTLWGRVRGLGLEKGFGHSTSVAFPCSGVTHALSFSAAGKQRFVCRRKRWEQGYILRRDFFAPLYVAWARAIRATRQQHCHAPFSGSKRNTYDAISAGGKGPRCFRQRERTLHTRGGLGFEAVHTKDGT